MQHLFLELAPLVVLAVLAPVPLAIVVTLLMSRDGLPKAVAYVAAQAAVYLAVGLVMLNVSFDFLGSAASVLAGLLLLAYGLGLWWWAVAEWRRGHRGSAATDLIARLDGVSVRGAALGGTVITLVNVKQLGLYLVATADIARAHVTGRQTTMVLVGLMLLVQLGQLVLIGIYVAARRSSVGLLARIRGWLQDHMRAASVVGGSLAGAFYLLLAVSVLG